MPRTQAASATARDGSEVTITDHDIRRAATMAVEAWDEVYPTLQFAGRAGSPGSGMRGLRDKMNQLRDVLDGADVKLTTRRDGSPVRSGHDNTPRVVRIREQQQRAES